MTNDLDGDFCSLMVKNRIPTELRPATIVHSGVIGTGPRVKLDWNSALDCSVCFLINQFFAKKTNFYTEEFT